MPIVTIALKRERSPEMRRRIADAVHRSLCETLGTPVDDRFQMIHTYGDDLIYDPGYLGINRTDDFVIVQILLFPGKPVELKAKLVAAVADNLHTDTGINRNDVMLLIHENPKQNFSFGGGILQFADIP